MTPTPGMTNVSSIQGVLSLRDRKRELIVSCVYVLSVSYRNVAGFEFCIMIEGKNQRKSLIYVLIL